MRPLAIDGRAGSAGRLRSAGPSLRRAASS